ncbi:M15 family metallopeptidase [Sanguibacter suaedae]|uniref:M15 family metallopeptidase n=1 Tax=Sanguibacter suaedae TaxID=2795737 RepID=A0A934M9T6_9MICO|nr:M15 family metallopeptidase [Sanguibacter suaedae]MBI9114925.1 M15 family metallopeptidase [Sanguibacter suaedae]
MQIASRLGLVTVVAALGAIAAGPATAAEPADGTRRPARISPAVTVSVDAVWEMEDATLVLTPAPPPPPPAPTPEEIAETRALSAAEYDNGTIPLDELCTLSFAPKHRLRCDAALALEDAYDAGMPSSRMTDSYRTLAGQVSLAGLKPELAAVPGTSQHGLGLAVDVFGPMQAWLHENGEEFGWVNPDWAKSDKYEPWHFEFDDDLLGDAS